MVHLIFEYINRALANKTFAFRFTFAFIRKKRSSKLRSKNKKLNIFELI